MKHSPITLLICCLAGSFVTAEPKRPVITYNDHIRPILRKYCLKCHGNDNQKADLNMQSFRSLLKGSSGGAIVKPGNSSASRLYQLITHKDEAARMPPNSPRLPARAIALIRDWIQSGVRQSRSSKSLASSRIVTFTPGKDAAGKPTGPPPLPQNVPAFVPPKTRRPLPVLALAASPWAPLVAVAGYHHIRLVHTGSRKTLATLPFPEGVPHVMRFSRNGKTLLAAGGKPVQSGAVVLFDVRSGKRLARLGDELDAVLSADMSPNQQIVVLGGSGRVVKAYSTSTGKRLYKLAKHTDWITAAAFSPNGKQLVTGDRAGGIHLWDATNGGILLSLTRHKGAVRGLAWRSDSKVIASAGEDGLLIWWNAVTGFATISKYSPHKPARPAGVFGKLPSGVLHASFARDGWLVTCGRDRNARLWDPLGRMRATIKANGQLPLQVAITHDNRTVIVGDDTGRLTFWKR